MLRSTLFALAMIVAGPASAGQICQSLGDAQAQTAAQAQKSGGEVILLSGPEARQYLDVVNSVPPLTHMDAENVLLLVVPDRGAVIGLVVNTNVCIAGRIGAAVHDRALKAARGVSV